MAGKVQRLDEIQEKIDLAELIRVFEFVEESRGIPDTLEAMYAPITPEERSKLNAEGFDDLNVNAANMMLEAFTETLKADPEKTKEVNGLVKKSLKQLARGDTHLFLSGLSGTLGNFGMFMKYLFSGDPIGALGYGLFTAQNGGDTLMKFLGATSDAPLDPRLAASVNEAMHPHEKVTKAAADTLNVLAKNKFQISLGLIMLAMISTGGQHTIELTQGQNTELAIAGRVAGIPAISIMIGENYYQNHGDNPDFVPKNAFDKCGKLACDFTVRPAIRLGEMVADNSLFKGAFKAVSSITKKATGKEIEPPSGKALGLGGLLGVKALLLSIPGAGLIAKGDTVEGTLVLKNYGFYILAMALGQTKDNSADVEDAKRFKRFIMNVEGERHDTPEKLEERIGKLAPVLANASFIGFSETAVQAELARAVDEKQGTSIYTDKFLDVRYGATSKRLDKGSKQYREIHNLKPAEANVVDDKHLPTITRSKPRVVLLFNERTMDKVTQAALSELDDYYAYRRRGSEKPKRTNFPPADENNPRDKFFSITLDYKQLEALSTLTLEMRQSRSSGIDTHVYEKTTAREILDASLRTNTRLI